MPSDEAPKVKRTRKKPTKPVLPRDAGLDGWLKVRCTQAELNDWDRAAKAAGGTLSAWVRYKLNG